MNDQEYKPNQVIGWFESKHSIILFITDSSIRLNALTFKDKKSVNALTITEFYPRMTSVQLEDYARMIHSIMNHKDPNFVKAENTSQLKMPLDLWNDLMKSLNGN
jgi:hypothetical protein